MTQIYKVGTATVSNGSTTVEGTDTGWATALVTGGLFIKDGLSVPIESVTDEDTLVLALPWPGDSGTGGYAIQMENSAAASVVGLYDRLRQATITLSLHSIHPDFIGTLAEIEAIELTPEDTEFVAARLEDGQPDEYYRWGGTDWVGPFPISKQGPAGVSEGGYGLPAGGATGQVPAKASSADGDVAWTTPLGASAIREKLTANRTYFVRTDGNDSNTGLVNSSGGAFLTIQKALNVVAALDISIYDVTIQLADGTYTGQNIVNGPWVGSGAVTVRGNTTTPASVVVQTTTSSNGVFQVNNSGTLTVSGMKLVASGGGVGVALNANRNGVITISNGIDFGACNNYHMTSQLGGIIRDSTDAFTISGSAAVHVQAVTNGLIQVSGNTITLTGTPAFSSSFASADRAGIIEYHGHTFVGSATGVRYSAARGGGVFVNGAGSSYLPGNADGSATSPGWYG